MSNYPIYTISLQVISKRCTSLQVTDETGNDFAVQLNKKKEKLKIRDIIAYLH